MLHLHQLSIGYRSRLVAQSLTASLPPASLTALIGRNGSGKSTLLRTVCGLQRPLAGKVSITDIDGKECQTGPTTVAIVLPPSRYQAPALTVEDNTFDGCNTLDDGYAVTVGPERLPLLAETYHGCIRLQRNRFIHGNGRIASIRSAAEVIAEGNVCDIPAAEIVTEQCQSCRIQQP